jgi:hypothetical protein
VFGILLYSPYTSDRTDCYTLTEDTIPTHCQIVIGRTLSSDQARLQGLVACSKLGPVYRWVLSKVFSLLLEVSLNSVVILRSMLSRYPIKLRPRVCKTTWTPITWAHASRNPLASMRSARFHQSASQGSHRKSKQLRWEPPSLFGLSRTSIPQRCTIPF